MSAGGSPLSCSSDVCRGETVNSWRSGAGTWQIQAALGSLYETAGEQAQEHTAFGEAARIIQELAQGITGETRRSRFLAAPKVHPALQHARRLATSLPDDDIEPSGR